MWSTGADFNSTSLTLKLTVQISAALNKPKYARVMAARKSLSSYE